jgi:hypothetical protein
MSSEVTLDFIHTELLKLIKKGAMAARIIQNASKLLGVLCVAELASLSQIEHAETVQLIIAYACFYLVGEKAGKALLVALRLAPGYNEKTVEFVRDHAGYVRGGILADTYTNHLKRDLLELATKMFNLQPVTAEDIAYMREQMRTARGEILKLAPGEINLAKWQVC